MKNIKIKISLIFAIIGLGLISCNDDALNLNDTTKISDLAVWNTQQSADMYITASYKTFSDVSQVANSRGAYYDSFSDLTKSTS